MKSSVVGRSWKRKLFLPFLLTGVFAALVGAASILHLLSTPLLRSLTAMERRPMRAVSGEIFLLASDTFRHLDSSGKENDPAEQEIARRAVLEQIKEFRAEDVPDFYRFAVLDDGNRILVESSPLLDGSDIPPLSGEWNETEFSFRDREGKVLLAHHRYFPFWRWHILTIVRKEDLAGEAVRIRNILYGAGAAGLFVVLSLTYLLFRTYIRRQLAALTRLEAMVDFTESSPNLMMMVKKEGSIVYANPSVERMLHHLGLPPQHYELLLPDDAEEIVHGVLSGGRGNRRGTCSLMGKTIDYTAFGLDREEAVVFIGVDVTERITAAEEPLRSRIRETIA